MIDVASEEVIDCDWHYSEDFHEVLEYMPEPWRTKFGESGYGEGGHKASNESFLPTSTGDRSVYGKIFRKHSDYPHGPESPERVREGMAHLDVDKSLIIGQKVLAASAAIQTDDERSQAFHEGYLEFLLDRVLDPADGVYGLVPLPYTHVDESLELLDRTKYEESIRGACLVTAGASPPLGNRKYDPIYERCQELGYPVVFHTGGSGLDEYARAGYSEFIETHTLGFLESNAAQIVSVTIQGVAEKFPDLDIVFMESGVAYLPGLIGRLDEEYLKRPEEAPLLERRPSEYITEYYVGTQPLEISMRNDFLEICFDIIGTDKLLYASDYPHWDFDKPSVIPQLPFVTDDEARDILSGNAKGVFGI